MKSTIITNSPSKGKQNKFKILISIISIIISAIL